MAPDVSKVWANEFASAIEDVVMDSGKPEADFPNTAVNTRLLFGARFFQSGHTTQWDYIHFGSLETKTPVPAVSPWGIVALALLILTDGAIVCRRRIIRVASQSSGMSVTAPAGKADV